MNILALDLGTKCGWASSTGPTGVWNVAPSRFDSHGQKWVLFQRNLRDMLIFQEINLIVYEEVRNHMAVDAAHSYGSFVALLQVVALEMGIEYKGVPVGTIKKYATGKGNAKKPEMISAAIKLYPSIDVIDDNHADALCLLSYAINSGRT